LFSFLTNNAHNAIGSIPVSAIVCLSLALTLISRPIIHLRTPHSFPGVSLNSVAIPTCLALTKPMLCLLADTGPGHKAHICLSGPRNIHATCHHLPEGQHRHGDTSLSIPSTIPPARVPNPSLPGQPSISPTVPDTHALLAATGRWCAGEWASDRVPIGCSHAVVIDCPPILCTMKHRAAWL